ncbi:MAG: hypothetical protein PUG76_00705 [Prevotellaceae bacterium]|nr:hypothetical protein [Prevotellaceae bacterium]
MKLKVTSVFRDRDDHVTVYEPETILEVKDKERAKSLIERGLCKEFKGKTAPTHILGREEDGQADEHPDTGAQEKEDSQAPEGDE